jgi:hypothetical protein
MPNSAYIEIIPNSAYYLNIPQKEYYETSPHKKLGTTHCNPYAPAKTEGRHPKRTWRIGRFAANDDFKN